jgi:vacuolar protein sorting-associated protein 45
MVYNFIFLFYFLMVVGDMAKFVSNYPEYRKTHGNVTKHVALVSEMSRIVEEIKLMVVSQTEQELACTSGQAAAFEVHFTHEKYFIP